MSGAIRIVFWWLEPVFSNAPMAPGAATDIGSVLILQHEYSREDFFLLTYGN